MEELFSSKKLDFAFHLSPCGGSCFWEFSIRALPAASLSLTVWTVVERPGILAWMLSHQVWRKKMGIVLSHWWSMMCSCSSRIKIHIPKPYDGHLVLSFCWRDFITGQHGHSHFKHRPAIHDWGRIKRQRRRGTNLQDQTTQLLHRESRTPAQLTPV